MVYFLNKSPMDFLNVKIKGKLLKTNFEKKKFNQKPAGNHLSFL